MGVANRVQSCLSEARVAYDVIPHRFSEGSRATAEAAGVPAYELAKAVVITDGWRYLMAVVPADRHLDLTDFARRMGTPLTLVAEWRLRPVFRDCMAGAIPPLGAAYGLETWVDDALVGLPEVYFESGDHEDLVRVRGDQFLRLMKDARFARLSH